MIFLELRSVFVTAIGTEVLHELSENIDFFCGFMLVVNI